MTGKRSYGDPCGLARALDVVGERWSMLVVRELALGPKRFADLGRGLPAMSENVLSQRLRELEQAGIVVRRRLGPPAGANGYELTALGAQLEPALIALSSWGARLPVRTTAKLSVDAFVMALKTMFDADAVAVAASASAGGETFGFELRIGADRFRGLLGGDGFQVARGTSLSPDVVLRSDVGTFTALVFEGLPVEEALARGDLRIEGDRAAAERFVRCFPLRVQPIQMTSTTSTVDIASSTT